MHFKIYDKNNYQKKSQVAIPSSTNQNTIIGFTPKFSSIPNNTTAVSLYKDSETIFSTTANKKLVQIPANTFIKEIYFFGKNNFNSDKFNIGFGDLNSKNNDSNNLIVDGTSVIANLPKGGYRNFSSHKATGDNDIIHISSRSFLNLSFTTKPTSGYLKVVLVLETLK
jgi:hypothetical protein